VENNSNNSEIDPAFFEKTNKYKKPNWVLRIFMVSIGNLIAMFIYGAAISRHLQINSTDRDVRDVVVLIYTLFPFFTIFLFVSGILVIVNKIRKKRLLPGLYYSAICTFLIMIMAIMGQCSRH